MVKTILCTLLSTGVLLTGLGVVSIAAAQEPQVGAGDTLAAGQVHGDIELTRKVIETQRQAIVSNALLLSEEEGKAFWPLFREYQSDRAKLRDTLVELILKYADAYPNLAPDEANTITDQVLELQADEIELKQKYLPRFRKVLPSIKASRFYQLENKLDAAVNMEIAKSVPLIW